MTRRLVQLVAVAALAFTVWSITTAPDREQPEWVPATVGPPITYQLETP